ncbi:hypothetical protein BGZ99_008744 [Dissophora globulifera]|uniref:Uncharacterized protein n=1 Tax=Dissophora globulifera TaxID=979702 RepID=A0A9P6R8S8_9FUNG|nr:hypothetical protein BGZ99_008744 [Dissophora globulifera]
MSPDLHQKQSNLNPPEHPLMTSSTSITSANLDAQNRHRSVSRPPSVESDNSANSVPFAPPPPAPPSAWKRFINQFTHRVIKRLIKFLVALYLGMLMTLIHQVAVVLGPTSYLATIIVMFMHPARTVGAQLEVTLFCVIGGILAAIWIIPCQVIVAAYNHKRALNESLDSSRALLNLSTRSFLLNHETIALPKTVIEKAQSEVRNAQKKLFTAYTEARYEVTYSKTNPADYKQVRIILSRLMRHLSSMSVIVHNERVLMLGPPDHDNPDLLTQHGSDSDSDSGSTGAENADYSDSDHSDSESVGLPGSRQTGRSRGEVHNQGDYSGNASADDALSQQSFRRRHRHQSREEIAYLTTEEGHISSRDPQPLHRRSTELRRVRQLLQRADNTAQTTIGAQQQHHEQLKQEALQHAPQFGHDDITSAPVTPGGRGVSGLFAHHCGHCSKRTARSSVTAPNSTRPNSIEEERSLNTRKSYRSSLSLRTGSKLKPRRPASLTAGFKFDQGKRQQDRSNEHDAGLSIDTVLDSTAPAQTGDRVLDDHQSIDRLHHTIHGESGVRSALTDSQARKAMKEYKRRHDKVDKREQKRRLEHEARVQQNMTQELPKEAALGDQKLFMSFLDIVQEPLLRLSDSCSRVMVAMERELVSGLSVERDRLERIKRRNAQRNDFIRAAEARTMEEKATVGSESPEKGLSITHRMLSNMHLGHLRALLGFSRRQPTKEEIAYAEALKSGMDMGKDERHNVHKQGLPNDEACPKQSTQQRNASPSVIEDDEIDFILPPNLSYVQYLTQELEIFDKAEARGLQDFIATNPTLKFGPREELYLIFFFLFALREVAREMLRLGKYVEELQEQARLKMEKEGRTKCRRQLWWPKVVGNFWHWFSWGSYSQVKTNEGYDDLVMNTTKNLGSHQPRSVEEEKMIIQAKTAAERQSRAEQNLETVKKPQVTSELSYQASIDFFNITTIRGQTTNDTESVDALRSQQGRNESDEGDSRAPSKDDPNTLEGPLHKPILAAQCTVIDIPNFESLQHQNSEPSRHFEDINLVNLAPQLDSANYHSNALPELDVTKPGMTKNLHQTRATSEPLHAVPTATPSDYQVFQQQSPPAPEPISPPRPVSVSIEKPKTWRYRLWESLQALKSEEFKFGFKMALAMSFIGLWSWLPWNTNVLLVTDRGQWAMLTIMAIMSPTIGATFSVCAMRIVGTIVGTIWAMITYLALPRNPYVICAMALIISSAGAYLILVSPQPKTGNVMMMSYISITLLMYRGLTGETIYQICYKRLVTVIVGIIVALAINSLLWPILARRELRKELANLIGREGMLFAELINKFMLKVPDHRKEPPSIIARPRENQESGDECVCNDQCKTRCHGGGNADDDGFQDSFIEIAEQEAQSERRHQALNRSTEIRKHESKSIEVEDIDRDGQVPPCGCHHNYTEDWRNSKDPDRRAFQGVEQQLQIKLLKTSELLGISASEPRLKGEFPMKLYKQIIQCCQNILDRIISMRMAAQSISPEVLELVAGPLNDNRRDVVGALLLCFSILSSSLATKSPLPPYLPSARMARLRVIYNVRGLISAHQAITGQGHYTFIYYYAYSSALKEVIQELELLAVLIEPLVGLTAVTSDTYDLSSQQRSEGAPHVIFNTSTPTAGQSTGLYGPSVLQTQQKLDEQQRQHSQLQTQVRVQQQQIKEQQERLQEQQEQLREQQEKLQEQQEQISLLQNLQQ